MLWHPNFLFNQTMPSAYELNPIHLVIQIIKTIVSLFVFFYVEVWVHFISETDSLFTLRFTDVQICYRRLNYCLSNQLIAVVIFLRQRIACFLYIFFSFSSRSTYYLLLIFFDVPHLCGCLSLSADRKEL